MSLKTIPLAFLFLSLVSCNKSYNCNCTYVTSAIGKTNLEESTTIKRKFKENAKEDCNHLEQKYWSTSYAGTCILE